MKSGRDFAAGTDAPGFGAEGLVGVTQLQLVT